MSGRETRALIYFVLFSIHFEYLKQIRRDGKFFVQIKKVPFHRDFLTNILDRKMRVEIGLMVSKIIVSV